MNVDRACAHIVVRAPAKLNLFFEVLGRRDDGYHEIETLMVPVTLWDTLVASRAEPMELRLRCDVSPPLSRFISLPPAEENLVTRSLSLLRERTGVRDGIAITLEKRIPSAAGLGGGSSDAAAALLAANELWNLRWSRPALSELATEIGSDVPFFLGDTAAVCRGRGEQIEPVAGLSSLSLVVVRPPEGLSTADVYAAGEVPAEPRHAARLIEALRRGDLRQIAARLYNRLEDAAGRLTPWVARAKQAFDECGAVAARMTGSGSAVYGLCRHARHARQVAERLQARNCGRTFVVTTCQGPGR